MVIVVVGVGGRGRGGPYGRGGKGGGCMVVLTSVPLGLQLDEQLLKARVNRRLGSS